MRPGHGESGRLATGTGALGRKYDAVKARTGWSVTMEVARIMGKLTEAEPYHREALEGFRRVLGDDDPGTLNSMNDLAATLRAQGDLEGARGLQEQVLEARRLVAAQADHAAAGVFHGQRQRALHVPLGPLPAHETTSGP